MPRPSPPSSATSASSSAVIVAAVISSAVVASAALYLLLRLLSRRCRRRRRTFSAVDDVVLTTTARSAAATSSPLIASLPAFNFGAVAGTLTGGDCAVCLSRFERCDLLRLLPLCCHAFHAQCVDTWLLSNATCPLCRSTVTPTDDEVLDKILSLTRTESGERSNSFRVEIGSISRRRRNVDADDSARSYSVGEFDYIIDESYSYEVPIESINHHRREISDDKFVPSAPPEMPPEELAAAVGGGRSWLREYVDRLSSVSSGRFFTGSSRRSEAALAGVVAAEEAERVGEEISELFRWLSGV